MKTIYIIGGKGFATECASYVIELAKEDYSISFGGFLGHNGYKVDLGAFSPFFVGDISEHKFEHNHYAVIGAGFPDLREVIFSDLKKRGVNIYNLVAKGCFIDPSVVMGVGNVFAPPFRSSVNIEIGNGNVFNGGVVTGHGNRIGDFNFFGPASQILGDAKVGTSNTIGANAILLPKSKVGNFNKISPLSVIYRGCGDKCYMHGSPAIKIGSVE